MCCIITTIRWQYTRSGTVVALWHGQVAVGVGKQPHQRLTTHDEVLRENFPSTVHHNPSHTTAGLIVRTRSRGAKCLFAVDHAMLALGLAGSAILAIRFAATAGRRVNPASMPTLRLRMRQKKTSRIHFRPQLHPGGPALALGGLYGASSLRLV